MKKQCLRFRTSSNCSWGVMAALANASNPVFFFSVMNRNRYCSFVFVFNCQLHNPVARWNEPRNLLRPFNQAWIAGIEVFVYSYFHGFEFTSDPVKIEVKYLACRC